MKISADHVIRGLPGDRAKKIRGYSFFLCGLLYIVTALTGVRSLAVPVAAVTILCLAQCLPSISGITRYAGAGLFGIGSVLFFSTGADLNTWFSAVTQNGKILTLMIFVPMLSIPFGFPGYRRSLEQVLQKMARGGSSGMYALTHTVSHLIGVIVNIACVSITYYMLKAGPAGRNPGLLARAAARGYTTTCFWSPNSGALGLVMGYWGGSVISIIPLGLPLAALALALGWAETMCRDFMGNKKGLAIPEKTALPGDGPVVPVADPDSRAYRDFRQLLAAVSLLLVLVIFFDWATPLDILTIVPLMSLTYPFLWSIVAGEQKNQWRSFKGFISGSLPNMSNEVVIFLGAGFFAVAVGQSGIGRYLPEVFGRFSGSPTMLVAVLLIAVVGLSLIGFHPVLTTTCILASITPQSVGLPVTLLSVMVVASWGLAVTCSPFSACSLSLSSITGTDPYTVGIRWQMTYTVLLFLVTLVYFNFVLLTFY
ncbi:MAG: hypothetical protein ACYC4H_00090 [Desulfocucumaceae bacterium]